MARINTLPSVTKRCPFKALAGVWINPVDRAAYPRINTLPIKASFAHKHSTFSELSTHKHSTELAAIHCHDKVSGLPPVVKVYLYVKALPVVPCTFLGITMKPLPPSGWAL